LGLAYTDLISQIHTIAEAVPLHYPGIEEDENIPNGFDEAMQYFVSTVISTNGNAQKILLAGFSSGGNLAFELAKKLEDLGYITTVLLIDCRPKEQLQTFVREELVPMAASVYSVLEHYPGGKELAQRYESAFFAFVSYYIESHITSGKIKSNMYILLTQDNSEGESWSNYTDGKAKIIYLPGNNHHELLHEKNNLVCISNVITQFLEEQNEMIIPT
jgi:hypothetical protein